MSVFSGDEYIIYADWLGAAFLVMFSIVVRHHLNYRTARDAGYLVQGSERIVALLCVPQHRDCFDMMKKLRVHMDIVRQGALALWCLDYLAY